MAITQKFNLPSVLGDEAKRYRELFEKGNNRTAAGSVSFTSATSGTTYNSTSGEAGIFAQLQTGVLYSKSVEFHCQDLFEMP